MGRGRGREGGRVSGVEGCPEKVVGCSLPLWEDSKSEEWVGFKSHLSQRKREPLRGGRTGPKCLRACADPRHACSWPGEVPAPHRMPRASEATWPCADSCEQTVSGETPSCDVLSKARKCGLPVTSSEALGVTPQFTRSGFLNRRFARPTVRVCRHNASGPGIPGLCVHARVAGCARECFSQAR